MNETQQKKIMSSIFGIMMVSGHLNDQFKMAKELKAIHYLLKVQENLSEQESDNCLYYFFKEYAQGCKQPISDSYIRNNMIPIIKNFDSMDLTAGASLLLATKTNL